MTGFCFCGRLFFFCFFFFCFPRLCSQEHVSFVSLRRDIQSLFLPIVLLFFCAGPRLVLSISTIISFSSTLVLCACSLSLSLSLVTHLIILPSRSRMSAASFPCLLLLLLCRLCVFMWSPPFAVSLFSPDFSRFPSAAVLACRSSSPAVFPLRPLSTAFSLICNSPKRRRTGTQPTSSCCWRLRAAAASGDLPLFLPCKGLSLPRKHSHYASPRTMAGLSCRLC